MYSSLYSMEQWQSVCVFLVYSFAVEGGPFQTCKDITESLIHSKCSFSVGQAVA